MQMTSVTKIADLKSYWRDVVTPDYEDFIKYDDDLRRAFHCAISLFHMHDWIYRSDSASINKRFTFKDKKGNPRPVTNEKTFANSISGICSDFEIVRNIANCAKHHELVRRPNAPPPRQAGLPNFAANTYHRISTTVFFFGLWHQSTGRIMLERPGGQDLSVKDLATSVYNFWPTFCKQNGWQLT